jgi:hypothetical protein
MNDNKHSLRRSTKVYGGKTHLTDSQYSDKAAPSGKEHYHLQFSLQAASLETFGYPLVHFHAGALSLGIKLSERVANNSPQPNINIHNV